MFGDANDGTSGNRARADEPAEWRMFTVPAFPTAAPADTVTADGYKAVLGSAVGYAMDGFDLLKASIHFP